MSKCPVLQDWVMELTFMKQSVLLAAIRGPDGIQKNHVAKLMLRWYRRCILISAFEQEVITNPYHLGGGSFTGPSLPTLPTVLQDRWPEYMDKVVDDYIRTLDEIPHHFQLHFMHAAEIVGYDYPTAQIATWWGKTYYKICKDMHLNPETKEEMNYRLGDNE